MNPDKVSGINRVHAVFNNSVDCVAKHTVHSFRSGSSIYQRLVSDHSVRVTQARKLSRYHSLVAQCFAASDSVEPTQRPVFSLPLYVGPGIRFDLRIWSRSGASMVFFWMCFVRGSPICSGMRPVKMDPGMMLPGLSFFFGFLAVTKRLQPFWFEGKWVMLDEDLAYFFALPLVVTLFRTWRRAVGSLCKVSPGVPVCYGAGARFLCPGVSGCFGLPSVSFLTLRSNLPRLVACGL